MPQTTQNPTRPTVPPERTSTEKAAPQGSETDALTEENQAAREGEEEEDEGEREEEQDDEEAKRDEEKKKKNKTAPDNEEKQANSTVAEEPLIPTPASTAKEKPTVLGSTAPATTGDDLLVSMEKIPTDVNAVSTLEPHNDSAEMQIPQSSTLSPKIGSDGKSLLPFYVHTGEETPIVFL